VLSVAPSVTLAAVTVAVDFSKLCRFAGTLSVMTVPCGTLSTKPIVPPIFSANVLQVVRNCSDSSSVSMSNSSNV
jgi:hypothetical protein